MDGIATQAAQIVSPAGGGATGGGATDPLFSNVELLLHLDGSDAATSTSDSSGNGHSITFNGGAELDAAQQKFGASSLLLVTTSTDYISTAASVGNRGGGEFTYECWVRFNGSSRCYVFDQGNEGSLIITPSTGKVEVYDGGHIINTGSTSFSTGQWYHIALTRSSNTFTLWRDGSSYVTGTKSTTAFGSATNAFTIGSYQTGGYGLNGWIDEIRVTSVCRYTTSFTPAGPFPNS